MKQFFETERISFVGLSESMVKDYLLMINDNENVERFIGNPHDPYTEEQELAWVREKLAHKELEDKETLFTLIEKKTGEFIGNIEFVDVKDSAAELGIALTASKQNMGFGTEAILAMIEYGKKELGLTRIYLRTRPFNARAIHVYHKCGFQDYDETEDHIFMEVK